MPQYWKFLRLESGNTAIISSADGSAWTIGEWRKVSSKIVMCSTGFHCTKHALDAFRYVPGEIVARVEGDGDSETLGDKMAWQRMRIIAAWRWTAQDSAELARFAANAANTDAARNATAASDAISAASYADAAYTAATTAAHFAATTASYADADDAAAISAISAAAAYAADADADAYADDAYDKMLVQISDWMEAHITSNCEPYDLAREDNTDGS